MIFLAILYVFNYHLHLSNACVLFPDINECAPAPCQNGATCIDLLASYRCECKSGYSGNNCETGENIWLRALFFCVGNYNTVAIDTNSCQAI